MFEAGNRSFKTSEEAVNYCQENDFDPDIMIQKTARKLYWYELLFRGISPGCQPKGFLEVNHDKGKFGILAYDRELTEQEIKEYEMREYIL